MTEKKKAEPDPAPADDSEPKAEAKKKGPEPKPEEGRKIPKDTWLLFEDSEGGKISHFDRKADALLEAEKAVEAGNDFTLYVRIR